jgi:hypothetical protein
MGTMIERVSDDFPHKVIQAVNDREVTIWRNHPRNKAYPIVSLGCIHIKYNTINL